MKYFCCIQMFLVVSTVHSEIRDRNRASDTESNCRSLEFEAPTTRKLDAQNKHASVEMPVRSGSLKVKVTHKNRHHKKKRRQKKNGGLSIPKTGFVNCTMVQPVCNVSTALYLTEPLEPEQNLTQTVTVASEIFEVFTKATTLPVNGTTIFPVTWSYQGNKSSEESDESKSTLIDYPFSVSIQKKGAHYASGALLDKFWVITAAGEFYNVRESLKLFRIRLGSVDCKSGGKIVPIKKIEIHPYYVYGRPNFDVALLRMAMAVDFNSFIRPIVISSIKGKVLSAKFMTTYWPRILVKGSVLPQHARERVKFNSMRVSTQRLIPDKECSGYMKNVSVTLNESSLCLRPVITHHTICTPDVGAPVIAEDGLWGITSGWVSPLCPMLSGPTVFTRLSSTSVRSWLDTNLDTSH